MRNTILAILCGVIFTATNSLAQSQTTIVSPLIGAAGEGLPLCIPATESPAAPFISSADPVALYYFNESLPVHDWFFPANYGPVNILNLGERITLPTPYGYVDSITVLIDSITQDSASINIVLDSLYPLPPLGTFHLINLFRQGTVLATAYVQSSAVHRGTYITVPMPHVRVDRDFQIVVGPTSSNGVYNVIFYAASVEPTRTRTAENARATYVGQVVANNQIISALADSTFILAGTTTIAFADFYTVAYVDTSGTTGVSDQPTSHRPIAISSYPNPTNGETHLRLENQNVSHGSSLKLYDALGRMVMDASDRLNNGELSLSMAALSPGVYCARYSEDGKIVRTAMLVRE